MWVVSDSCPNMDAHGRKRDTMASPGRGLDGNKTHGAPSRISRSHLRPSMARKLDIYEIRELDSKPEIACRNNEKLESRSLSLRQVLPPALLSNSGSYGQGCLSDLQSPRSPRPPPRTSTNNRQPCLGLLRPRCRRCRRRRRRRLHHPRRYRGRARSQTALHASRALCAAFWADTG